MAKTRTPAQYKGDVTDAVIARENATTRLLHAITEIIQLATIALKKEMEKR